MKGMFFREMLKLINYEKEIHILEKDKFTKDYKMSFKDFIISIVGNRGKTLVLELDDFFRIRHKNISRHMKMTTTKQNFSKRRMYIDPEFFKKTSKNAIKELYSSNKYQLSKFKGYYIFVIDGSQVKLPNTPQTREEFITDLNPLKKSDTLKARISVMSDAKNEFIIESSLADLSIGESVLAHEHIEKASTFIDLKKVITIYDRGYASAELILQLLEKESHFIFRLKSDTYKKRKRENENR